MKRVLTGFSSLSAHKWERWALVGLFLLAFLPRAVYPVSRPLQWYFRSAQFLQAMLQGDLAGTLFSEHPGVTVMWLSGTALWGWYALQSLLGLNPPAPLETEGYAFADRVAVGVLPLALVVALGILWGWCLLRRLFDRRVAWVAALLWALDPFYLANSKVLHLDATLSTLMLLSALWMLVYLRERRSRQLVLSAVLAGLALLTKTSALFLVPFLILCLLSDLLIRILPTPYSLLPSSSNLQICHREYSWRCKTTIYSFLLWLLVAVVVCLALWPALWVQPGASLDLVIRRGVLLHTGSPRDQPFLYRGVLAVQDPGPRFYLDVLLFRTTFLTLPFALLGLVSAWVRRGEEHPLTRPHSLTLLLLGGFGLFYFAQMSLGGWKDGRYMLPVFLVLAVLAASGLLWWADRVHEMTHLPSLLLAGLLLTAQAVVVFSHHPYYGTHYNTLMGGPAAALNVFPPADFGEGLDRAGRYVDTQLAASVSVDTFVVGTQFLANEMLAQHIRASVYDVAQIGEEADVLVFGAQYTMRGLIYPRWGALWEQTYKFREPEFVVSFDDIPYAWVHRPVSVDTVDTVDPVIPRRVNARLGDTLYLVGYRLAQDEVAPGDTLLLTLYWRAEEPVERNYTVFAHLQGADGRLVAQQDNPPMRGTRPTSVWEVGTVVEDPYELRVPLDTPPGDYLLSVGMYDPASHPLTRLPAFGADGRHLPEDRVVLAMVQVRPAVPWWRWALSGLYLAVIATGIVWPSLRRRV
ncbi:MAG: glycosyltransferase family 39 protein [Anaerolineae bacterium]|nr:glycosyltransferase family 39 protein [Anaerolineae bacterium]